MNDSKRERGINMKRLILLVCLLTFTLTSCETEYTATDLLAKIMTLPIRRDAVIYFNGADADGAGYLSRENTERLYGGQSPASLSADYALALGKNDDLFEIHLYYALDAQLADEVEVILRERVYLLQKKDNELYLSDASNVGVMVWRRGNWVILLATEDNDSVKELLKSII